MGTPAPWRRRAPSTHRNLFAAVADFIDVSRALYPACHLDPSAADVFPHVTYFDTDRIADRCEAHDANVATIVHADHNPDANEVSWTFGGAEYTDRLEPPEIGFDLLVSLYSGFASSTWRDWLAPHGHLIAHNGQGDASLAALDPGWELVGIVHRRNNRLWCSADHLARFLTPLARDQVDESVLRSARLGVAYRRMPEAYLFRLVD